jgi:hypothetical protein
MGAATMTGCSSPIGLPDTSAATRLLVSASVVGTPIDILVATVTAPDIEVPLVRNLTVRDGVASGTLILPPGLARTITVAAFDDQGLITHEGSATIDVQRGQNTGMMISMIPRVGEIPITVQVGSVRIALSQASASLAAGSAMSFTATIHGVDGQPVNGTPAWATTAPDIASISRDGLVTGLRPGTAQIVATFAGVAAVATIEVTAVPDQP